jgi:hypothetical protein
MSAQDVNRLNRGASDEMMGMIETFSTLLSG